MHNLQQFVGVCVVVDCIRVPSHSGNTRGSVKAAAASSELHPVSSETCCVVVFHFPDSPAPETLHARTPNAVLFNDAGGCSRWIPAGRHSSAHVLARCRLPHMTCPSCLRPRLGTRRARKNGRRGGGRRCHLLGQAKWQPICLSRHVNERLATPVLAAQIEQHTAHELQLPQ